ncbi:CocE/NonD family hydrolase [Bacillus tamaricis]|uniref:CocE/NonD family hydrolase n=2 Tax=Evansella tamaricis TaxID=2069301 RepID=A0ABS6JC34_9BACI|nr:CocE/NonD family hydrolase [Evansella tamaricis]
MRDGITLSADIYRPADDGEYPAIVVRTPYLKTSQIIFDTATYFSERGYAVIYMDVRGRGDSDGEFSPYRNDGIDGYDAIEWVAEQPWCTGAVGTMGGSYLGRIQWLTALTKPPHLKAMISAVTPSDPFVEWPTGLPNTQHICWTYMTSGRVMQNIDTVNWEKVYDHLPFVDMDEAAGFHSKIWREEVSHTKRDDWWEKICYQNKFDQIDVPALHISGWYDDEQVGTPLNYMGMTENGGSESARKSQRMLMGPWPHQINRSTKLGDLDFGADSQIDLNAYQLRWFDYWLKGMDNGVMEEPPIDMFVMGENEWRQESEWPLARTNWTTFYLHSKGNANSRFGDGWLTTDLPATAELEETATDQYDYDPKNPVPFITDLISHQIGGPDDYAAIERRDDVLVYSTPPLEEDVEVTGPIKALLYASSNCKDTDFMVKLLDVRPTGFAQRLTDGMVRARFREGMDNPKLMEPDTIYPFEVDCWNTSHVFKKGHRIRIEIASSAFPKYDRNLNTGDVLGQTTEMKVATQTIYHDSEHPSAIVLPIIPKE